MNPIISVVITIVGFIIINTFFHATPYLLPRQNMNGLISYQIWANVMFFFYLVLPKYTGVFNFEQIQNETTDNLYTSPISLKSGRKRRKK
jgi:hypothetical protein